ncbi:uncharacterized protein LOC114360208 [Ostrinia furnacalis]|uniref:uncharacterized protein LOC114360208 n=1 Tax=Ostrinia furnacalis TaxID=93504 RepID=UPI00103B36CB|nr:uncharacterized protein LOC114360208 [Ostrinia furnacalis]
MSKAMTERYSKEYTPERPTPLDLPLFLPYACSQLQAPFDVRVNVELQDEYVSKTAEDKSKKGKSAKSTVQHTSRTFDSPQRQEESASAAAPLQLADDDDEPVIALTAVCDAAGALVELAFRRAPQLPRLLLKVLGMCVPFHPALARLTVRWGPLGGEALHELAKFLPLSHITDVCLDDSPVPECNYDLLLERPSQLRSLSLARCQLDDRDCRLLAARLAHPLPAARTLLMLSLAANVISDDGARALAAALRSNRALQYLNLSGNRIGDDGAGELLGSLTEFPLTHEELITKRRRRLEYLRLRDEVTRKCHAELAAAERAQDEFSRSGKRRQTVGGGRGGRRTSAAGHAAAAAGAGADPLALKAQAMAGELLGRPHADPFGAEGTVSRDGYVFSAGNPTLVALNLSYNALGFPSLARLAAVLRYQERTRARGGLLRVLLEGNALPVACRELARVQELLERALSWKLAKPPKTKPERPVGKAKSK